MKRRSVAVGAVRHRCQHGLLGPVSLSLGLILWAAGSGKCLAQRRFWPQTSGDSSAASRTVDPAESVGSASEEIWISCEAPGEAAGPESAFPGEARSPLASRLVRVASPDRARESAGQTPSRTSLTLSERLKAAQRDLLEDLKQERDVLTPPKKVDDGLLFHTTSGPAKPAALVFRPATQSERVEAVPALPKEDLAGLQLPLRRSVGPEMRARPTHRPSLGNVLAVESPQGGRALSGVRTSTPLEHPAVTGQVSNPPEVALPGSIAWGKQRSSSSILEAAGSKPPEASLSASLVRTNAPAGRSALNAEAGGVRSNEPIAMDRSDREALLPPMPSRLEDVPSPAQAAGTDSEAVAEKLVLQVRVAEFDRARGRKWGILGLKFSRRPPLLESLLEAESGVQSILLDCTEPDDVQSQIGLLEREGVLRVRGQPSLVTASGRQAKLLTSGNRVRLASAAGGGPTSASGDWPRGLTLRPVLIGDEQIQLEVTGPRSGKDSHASHDETAAPVARTGSATVRMRVGQTVAIRGLGHVPSEGEEPQKRASLAKVLGLGKPSQQQSELILFVTPEPIRSTPPVETASRPDDQAPDGEKEPSWLSNWIGRR
jgi:hypothetical protein